MIKSMTGYGRGESVTTGAGFTVEIKTVNNRYRDVVFRLPKDIQPLEDVMRTQIVSRIKRGRIEVSVQMGKNGEEQPAQATLNLPLVQSYMDILRQMSETFGLDPNIRAETLCQMKDVIQFTPREVDIEAIQGPLKDALGAALESLEAMRLQEGRAIGEDLKSRLRTIEECLDAIEKQAPRVVESYRERLKERILQLHENMDLDEGRLLQEVAIFADRCDITEEVVRTRSHLKQFHETLTHPDAIGRRLDFLVQEIHREVNTTGTKATDASVSAKVVEIKAELEKIREQIQNVE